MKKIVFALMVFSILSTQAQEKMNLTPEQSATLKTKEITLQLELNEQQQKKVHSMLFQMAEERKAKRKSSEERKAMTDVQRYEERIARLDQQIAVQNKMKSILNEKQYTTWKESSKKRMTMMKRKKAEHKRKSKHRTKE